MRVTSDRDRPPPLHPPSRHTVSNHQHPPLPPLPSPVQTPRPPAAHGHGTQHLLPPPPIRIFLRLWRLQRHLFGRPIQCLQRRRQLRHGRRRSAHLCQQLGGSHLLDLGHHHASPPQSMARRHGMGRIPDICCGLDLVHHIQCCGRHGGLHRAEDASVHLDCILAKIPILRCVEPGSALGGEYFGWGVFVLARKFVEYQVQRTFCLVDKSGRCLEVLFQLTFCIQGGFFISSFEGINAKTDDEELSIEETESR